jgi:hypothetical protein
MSYENGYNDRHGTSPGTSSSPQEKLMIVTKQYLCDNPDHVFVFGDNLIRKGKKGAAALRDMPNTFGFVTKRYPDSRDSSFFRPADYEATFRKELARLEEEVRANPDKTYLVSKLGGSKYGIFEKVIRPRIVAALSGYPNVRFLFRT